jgi:hypothetical protein
LLPPSWWCPVACHQEEMLARKVCAESVSQHPRARIKL